MPNLYLEHHGIKGMKWGVRRYQNSDGSLTSAGRKRYSKTLYKKMSKKNAKNKDFSNSKEIKALKNDPRYRKAIKDVRDSAKGIKDKYKTIDKAEEAYSSVVSDIVKDFVGKYGDMPISKVNYKTSYKQEVMSILWKDTKSKSSREKNKSTKNSDFSDGTRTPSMKGNPNKESDISAYNRRTAFMDGYKPPKGSKNTLYDIDDYELIDLNIDDPAFRKEYGVSDKDYERYKKIIG